MTTNEKVKQIRDLFGKEKISAYIIPNSDPHISEYIPEYYRFRTFVSGFTGSAGTLVIAKEKSGLWTDGRYFTQAEQQLSGSEIELYRMAEKGVPTIPQFFANELCENAVIGMDGDLVSVKQVKEILDAGAEKHLSVNPSLDFAKETWTDSLRPACPSTEVYEYEVKYAGESTQDKIKRLREKCAGKAILVTRLDSNAWLFNLRASDVAFNPVALSYGLITADKAYFFTNTSRVNDGAKKHLEASDVELMEYGDITKIILSISDTTEIYYDEDYTNYNTYLALCKNKALTPVSRRDIVTEMKAIKNDIEIKNIINAQVKDGCALTEAYMKIDDMLEKGEKITELDVSELLLECREKQELNKGASFNSIVGFGENAAMMHYAPTAENNSALTNGGMLLVDSGGQYLDGTCDMTRTIGIGDVALEQKQQFTTVLRAMISLARAKFLRGATGAHLDVFARHVVWEQGLDYRCGTGHGVGCFLNVHEGPQSMRKDLNNVVVVPGMILTDEPGIYVPGSHGIRTENMLLAYLDETNEYGDFLRFQTIGFFPIDTTLVVKDMMHKDEIQWLNDYHKMVYETLSPRLSSDAKKWLENKTKAI